MKVFNISIEEYRKKPDNVSLFTKDMIAGLELITDQIDSFIAKSIKNEQTDETEFLRDFFVELSNETGDAEVRRPYRYAFAA